MSGVKRKLEGEVEIKESAGDVYYELFKNTPHHFSQVAPHFFQGCDLHEGEHGKIGSIIVWRYQLGEKVQALKCVMDEIDDEKKVIKQRAIEGEIMEDYKSINSTCQVISKKTENISIIKWTLEYEKKHQGIGEPSALLDTILDAATYLENHPLAAKNE